MLIVWAVFVGTMIVTFVKYFKEIRCMKDRRKLLDEVCDYLQATLAISGRNLESHNEFMQKFCKRFEKDRF